MYEKTRGIVLHVIKCNERNSIVHIYTDTHGRMSFLLPQGATRGARLRNAMFMPLSIVEFEARISPGRDIATMKDCRCPEPLASLRADPVKSMVAMFVSELLSRSVQESEGNEPLFRFITTSVRLLDSLQHGVANFHICFLFHLGLCLFAFFIQQRQISQLNRLAITICLRDVRRQQLRIMSQQHPQRRFRNLHKHIRFQVIGI